ncbi:hypothetical protein AB0L00_35080 [Actinoallomurus sp. NPDC052308]|uniref:hypothetical protein n=1 Tax=Actinoallomurus sp. NPDC052308 TaxID=3155530 RepID=UPI0034280CAB
MWIVFAMFIALAVLGPLVGADSRDGLDWARNNFWMRRRPALKAEAARTSEPTSRPRVREHRTVPAAR